MKPLLRVRNGIPVTLSVPIVVVLLMVFVSVGASQLVLSRLAATQERQLGDLANAYLDGLEAALLGPVLRQDSWEVFDTLDRARSVYAAMKPIETTVTDAQDVVLASSEPRLAPIGTRVAASAVEPRGSSVTLVEDAHLAVLERTLAVGGGPSAGSIPDSIYRHCWRNGARCFRTWSSPTPRSRSFLRDWDGSRFAEW